MDMKPEQLDAIAWLNEGIGLFATDYQPNKDDMEECLMKIAAYSYAIKLILDKVE